MKLTSTWLVVAVALSLTGSAISAAQSSQSGILLESARQKETLEGDLRGAIRIYQDIVNRFGRSDRAAAASAMLRIAECYERLGDPQGSQIYQRLMAEYPEQTAAVATARTRLASGGFAPWARIMSCQRLTLNSIASAAEAIASSTQPQSASRKVCARLSTPAWPS